MIPRQKLSAYKKVDFSANEPATPQSELSSKIELLDDSPLEPEIIEPFGDDSPVQAFPSKYHQKKSQEQDYQEMLIVRQSLDFDERQFRDSYIKTESEIILKMRKDVDSLYDWLDKMVAELTKTLNQCQEAKRGSTEDKLKTIREHSVRADAINRSIQNFLSSIQHAYQHTFAAFLDSNAPPNGAELSSTSDMLGVVIDFVKGFVFFLQLLTFGAFTAYAYNEFLALKRRSLLQEFFDFVLPLLLKYGILEQISEPSLTQKSAFKVASKIQAPFEHSEWLNDLLDVLFCKNSIVEQEALLQVLTKVSRKAIQSKLQDYQKESWLFLSSLNLDSFSFGSKLPQIKSIRSLQQGTGKLALVIDFDYEGGIEVGLKAAMALNIRDFQAKLQFRESKFKLVIKSDSLPTPRMSFMISEMPDYDVSVLMHDQPLIRAGNLIKTMLTNFIKNRLCFPSYLTLLIRPTSKHLIQIASEKHFQSQMRLRVTTVQLNLLNPNLVGSQEEDPAVMCVLSFGNCTSKTDAILASSSRWNSIHSFNIFNGLDESPQSIKITLYQVIDAGAVNVLGKAEIPYSSIKPGILDIRQVHLLDDSETTISLELFLHHMQEDGAADASWIFWNSPRPRVQATSQSLEQMNWNTIKYIIARLSTDSQADDRVDLVHSFDESEMAEEVDEARHQVTAPLLTTLSAHIEWSLSQLKERLLRKREDSVSEAFDDSHDPLHRSLSRAVAIVEALKLELSDFSARFDLTRAPLSEAALQEHNKRLASLLLPLLKSFFSSLTVELKFLKANARSVESLYFIRTDRVQVLEERIQGLWSLIVKLSKGEYLSTAEELPTTDSTPELATMQPKLEFKCFWGDQPVVLSFANEDFVSIKHDESPLLANRPGFDFEGVFYTKDPSTVIDLSSHDIFDSMTAWEVVLIGKALMLIPFGKDHQFPQEIISLTQVESLELVRDRGAFHLGFNADLSAEQTLEHANCAVLRLKGSESVLAELVGDSRTCDQFYCLLSSRLGSAAQLKFPLSRLLKTWLLPLSVPAYSTQYALALNLDNSTFVLGNFEDEAIHEAFCQLKQLAKPSSLLTVENSHSLSSMSSSMASVSSLSSSMSSVFDSRTKYNRISFHNHSTEAVTPATSHPEWIEAAFENISTPLQCTFNGSFEGQIVIAKDYLAFWTPAIVIPIADIKSAKKSGELGVELLMTNKSRHLLTFKTVHDCERFLETILL